MKLAVFTLTTAGVRVAAKIAQTMGANLHLPISLKDSGIVNGGETVFFYEGSTKEETKRIWDRYEGIVYVMSLGIVNRIISGNIHDKHTDPAVVVVDEMGRYAISALSGHEGGANRLSEKIALICEGDFVVTTGSEAVKTVIAGMGCRRGISSDTLEEALIRGLEKAGRNISELRLIASVEDKKDEKGLLELSERIQVPLKFISKEWIKCVEENFDSSPVVKKALGISAVAEPCAILGGFRCKLILPKTIYKETTIALAEERFM